MGRARRTAAAAVTVAALAAGAAGCGTTTEAVCVDRSGARVDDAACDSTLLTLTPSSYNQVDRRNTSTGTTWWFTTGPVPGIGQKPADGSERMPAPFHYGTSAKTKKPKKTKKATSK